MLELHQKLARLQCQKSFENQLDFWAKNLLIITLISGAEIYQNSLVFLDINQPQKNGRKITV